ncbi:hypothetical protein HDE_05948 [Halotydeus destructor]|nr:hypothetical protein HDE_05948 [Halotydeus destructor]
MSAASSTPNLVNNLSLVAVKLVSETSHLSESGDCQTSPPLNSTTESSTSGFSTLFPVTKTNTETGDVIGFVALATPERLTLREFRTRMSEQIIVLPQDFYFLSREGWPVTNQQENFLTVHYVITPKSIVFIRRQYSSPRFGVQFGSGLPVGFIYCEFSTSAKAIREKIGDDLSEFLENYSFCLLDKNGWPVTQKQEESLCTWDLVNNGTFTIKTLKRRSEVLTDVTDSRLKVLEKSPSEEENTVGPGSGESEEEDDPPTELNSPVKTRRLDKQSSQADSDDNQVGNSMLSLNAPSSASSFYITTPHSSMSNGTTKHILISYVRNEAEQHARNLKRELTDIGCNVYLDVDEIQGGHDWQDALNNAVRNCEVFVPLITPQYGLTQWTNREVKLADILNKLIIPVNFNDTWPPECLAIQFATTQFLSWKTPREIEDAMDIQGDRAADIRYWDTPFVHRAAVQVAEISRRKLSINLDSSLPSSGYVSMNSVSHSMSHSSDIEPQIAVQSFKMQLGHNGNNRGQDTENEDTSETETDQPNKIYDILRSVKIKKEKAPYAFMAPPAQPLVVICAHPDQRDFVETLRVELAADYEVWSSTDMEHESYEDDVMYNSVSPTTPVTCVSLPPFPPSQDNVDGEINYSQIFSQESVAPMTKSFDVCQLGKQRRRRHRLNLSFSSQTEEGPFSQASEFGSQQSIFSPEEVDRCKTFRDRIRRAKVVLVILSQSYYDCRQCKRQYHYCDYRKPLIAVKYDSAPMPMWCSKLNHSDLVQRPQGQYDTELPIASDGLKSFINQIVQRAQLTIANSKETFKNEMTEVRNQALGKYLGKKLQMNDRRKIFVYILGGTKFYNAASEGICRALGSALAAKDNIVLVTSGFHGAADTLGRAFYDERSVSKSRKEHNTYHVLPKHHDNEMGDYSMKARQSENGQFVRVPFGSTEYIGDCVQQRDSVVSCVFNYCILVEGGPSSAKIAQEFIYNDNIVIPIMCTGGAAEGQFSNSDTSLTEVPAGVNAQDWKTLGKRDVTADEIASAVIHILFSLSKIRSWKGKNAISMNPSQSKWAAAHGFKWRHKNKHSRRKDSIKTLTE